MARNHLPKKSVFPIKDLKNQNWAYLLLDFGQIYQKAFLPPFLDQSVEHLLAWHVNLSHTNVNLLNTKMLYRRSVQQNYISNIKLFDRLTLVLFDRFSGKIFQQIDMCDRFTPWFSVQQICKLAKLSVQICWTNQWMVDAVLSPDHPPYGGQNIFMCLLHVLEHSKHF